MKTITKITAMAMALLICAGALVSCGGAKGATGTITVVSREDGSGTRGAFIELFGVEEKASDGTKTDRTYDRAEITNSTSVMLATVEGNTSAIGYVSLGSLGDTVKALKIDGTEATAENIKNGSYKVSRPFNIVTKDGFSDDAQDFIDFILSAEGQKVIEDAGYISEGSKGSYKAADTAGKITIAGSSSVSPAMEKLKEAYCELNPKATIEIQTNDSTTGVNSAISGVCEIGMASRELKDSESSQGLSSQVIALDGIAVIVNKANELDELTSDKVKSIFTGETTVWEDLQG